MLEEGVWAEVKVGAEHLRLFSEHSAQGVQASVYNVNAKNWIAPSENRERYRTGERPRGSTRSGISTPRRRLRTAPSELEEIPLSVVNIQRYWDLDWQNGEKRNARAVFVV
jgi:hypothetical protein